VNPSTGDEQPDESGPVEVPHRRLSPEALRGVIEEFVTRDGTEHSELGAKVRRVLALLDAGEAVLTFDPAQGTCQVVPRDRDRRPEAPRN
jgi:uncharacterized protein YheU (UPF0270 family)